MMNREKFAIQMHHGLQIHYVRRKNGRPDNTKMLSYVLHVVLCRVKIAISRDVALFENPLPIPFHQTTYTYIPYQLNGEESMEVPETIIYLFFRSRRFV